MVLESDSQNSYSNESECGGGREEKACACHEELAVNVEPLLPDD